MAKGKVLDLCHFSVGDNEDCPAADPGRVRSVVLTHMRIFKTKKKCSEQGRKIRNQKNAEGAEK